MSTVTNAALKSPPDRAPRPPRDPRDARFAWPFVLPVQLLVLAAIAIPAIYVFWLSFYESSYGQDTVFVGLRNYSVVLSDPYFWSALRNTVVVVAVVVHVELVLGLGLALLFYSGIPFSRFMIAAVL